MKLNKLKVILTVLVMIILVPSMVSAASKVNTGDLPPQATDRTIELQVNGKTVNGAPDMGKMFLSKNGKTYLPIRMFQESMGYKLRYNHLGRGISIELLKPLPNNRFTIFTYIHPFKPFGHGMDGTYAINNLYSKKFTGGGFPILYGDRLYIPAREVFESLGEKVQWKRLPDKDIVNVIKK